MFRIAVDVMGGDRGPGTILDGALEAAREGGVPLALVGPETELRRWLAERPGAESLDLTTVHAGDAIGLRRAGRFDRSDGLGFGGVHQPQSALPVNRPTCPNP